MFIFLSFAVIPVEASTERGEATYASVTSLPQPTASIDSSTVLAPSQFSEELLQFGTTVRLSNADGQPTNNYTQVEEIILQISYTRNDENNNPIPTYCKYRLLEVHDWQLIESGTAISLEIPEIRSVLDPDDFQRSGCQEFIFEEPEDGNSRIDILLMSTALDSNFNGIRATSPIIENVIQSVRSNILNSPGIADWEWEDIDNSESPTTGDQMVLHVRNLRNAHILEVVWEGEEFAHDETCFVEFDLGNTNGTINSQWLEENGEDGDVVWSIPDSSIVNDWCSEQFKNGISGVNTSDTRTVTLNLYDENYQWTDNASLNSIELAAPAPAPAPAPVPAPAPAPVIITYQVVYSANGGNGSNLPSSGGFENGAVVVITSSAPTRTGFTFQGWNTSADGLGDSYLAGAPLLVGSSNVVLYAQWKINTYMLHFDSGGEDLLKIDSKIENYGSTIVLSTFPDGYTRTGYTFMGWNTVKDGSGRMLVNGDKFTVPASDTTLYAQWKINSYTIFLDGNGLNNGRVPASITREFNSILKINLPEGIFTRKGYKFECWNTAPDGSGQDFKAGDQLVIGAKNQTLFAKWIPITYRVNYRSAYQDSPMFDQFVTGGMISSSPIPKNRPGYIFKGWSISPLKKNVLSFPYAPGVTRNLSLYAVWEKQK